MIQYCSTVQFADDHSEALADLDRGKRSLILNHRCMTRKHSKMLEFSETFQKFSSNIHFNAKHRNNFRPYSKIVECKGRK
jgi:hypothetical protein